MIRLKHILLEEKQIPNVLFISDNGDDKRKGYARKLISNKIVTGEIYTADEQSSKELVSLVYYNISSGYYDAAVIHCSGLFDDNSESVISNLESISDICNRKKITPIFISIPTDKFIKSDKYTPIEKISINTWIKKQKHISLSKITDDIYFTLDGMRLDKEGQNIIYNKLKNIFSNFFKDEDSEEIPNELQPRNLRKLQDKLNKLGYIIDKNEINNIELGDSTKESIKQFQLKNSLPPTGELNKRTLVKLFSFTAIPYDINDDPIRKVIKAKKSKGVQTTYKFVMNYLIDKGLSIAGAAGISGNIQVDSDFKTNTIKNNGETIGLVQWQGKRKDKFLSWCDKKKLDALSLNAQLDYLWNELITTFSLLTDKLKIIEDAQEAAEQFADEFQNLSFTDSKRKEYAQEFFDEYNQEDDSSLTGIVTTLAAGGLISLASVIKKNASIPKSSQEFFNQWKSIAVQHENQYGIPVSITLAQAAIESAFGKSGLTRKYNNFFGITGKYKGNSVKMKNKKGQLFTWRVYPTPEDSFNDHAELLNRRYKPRVKNPTYIDWAKSITDGGYAEANYGSNLIKFIKQNGLDEYDSNTPTVDSDNEIQTDISMSALLELPFTYKDISSLSKYKRKGEPLKSDKYFIIHHTAGHMTPAGVVNVLNNRIIDGKHISLGVQWVVDRNGNVFRTLPAGSRGAHILPSELGPNNDNSQGVEVIAKTDADVLPIQAAAVLKLVKALGYSSNQIYGHGEVNPGHKAADEGRTIKQYIQKYLK